MAMNEGVANRIVDDRTLYSDADL